MKNLPNGNRQIKSCDGKCLSGWSVLVDEGIVEMNF